METQLNKSETARMMKIKNALSDMFDGHLAKYGVTPFEVKELALCYSGLVYDVTHSTDTAILGVKNFFEKYGFLVEDTGTGTWDIYVSSRIKKLCEEYIAVG